MSKQCHKRVALFTPGLFLLVLALLFGCKEKQSIQQTRSYPVNISEAKVQDVPIFIDLIGNIYAPQIVQVRPQVGGIIEEAFVKEGQYVAKGDPLYQIDPRPYKDALDAAKATLLKDSAALKFAEIKVERYSELVKKDYASKLNFDQYTTEVAAAKGQVLIDEANLSLAELNLEWTTVLSPIDGKISLFGLDPGNLVAANDSTAITNIRQINPIDVFFYVTQKNFVAAQKSFNEGNLKCEVFLPEKPENPRSGKIYFIDNHLDLSTGTILFKASLDNVDELFWPGEFVKVRLQLGVLPNAVLVPEEAIQMGQEGPFLYVYHPKTSQVEYRRVKKGESIDQNVVIKSGIQEGERVVVQGQLNLRPGSKVQVVEFDGSEIQNQNEKGDEGNR